MTTRCRNRGRWASLIDWTQVPLGKAADSFVAYLFGTTEIAVAHARRRYGVSSWRSRQSTKPVILRASEGVLHYTRQAIGRFPVAFKDVYKGVIEEWGTVTMRTVHRAIAHLAANGEIRVGGGLNNREYTRGR